MSHFLDTRIASESCLRKICERVGDSDSQGIVSVVFECHLTDPDHRVDFGLSFDALEIDHCEFENKVLIPLLHGNRDDRGYQRIIDLFRESNYPGPLGRTRHFWLLFDILSCEESALPTVYLHTDFLARGMTEKHSVAYLRALLGRSGDLLLDNCSNSSVALPLGLVKNLPPGCGLFAIGYPIGRFSDVTRLSLTGFDHGSLVQYLQRIGWPGLYADLNRYLPNLEAINHYFALDLDVRENQILPRIGVECYGIHYGVNARNWCRQLCKQMESHGLCKASVMHSIENWLGETPLSDRDNFLSDRMQRGITHFKLILEAGKRAQLKVYLPAYRVPATRWLSLGTRPPYEGIVYGI